MMKRALVPAALISTVVLAAAPAFAAKAEAPNTHQFTGSATAVPTFTGETELTLKPFTVTCEKAAAAKGGAPVAFPTKTLGTTLKLGGCSATAKISGGEYELKAKVSPITVNYRASGAVEIGTGGTLTEGKLVGAGPVEVSVSGAVKCTIAIAAGTYPSAFAKHPEEQFETAKYSTMEETVERHKMPVVIKRLGITTALSHLPYELSGPFCESLPKTEQASGTLSSSLEAGIRNGDLGWE
jgi:hypothetical protein